MNKSYKSVWNESTGSWVAVSELATGRSKSKRAKTAISKAILTQIAVGGMSLAGVSVAMADDTVKSGTNATVNIADGVAIGVDSQVDPDAQAPAKIGGIAVGDSAYAVGSGVAVGQASSAASDSAAFGSAATAGNGGTAIGANAYTINNGGVALGQNATATGGAGVALGQNSLASGAGSVALGQGSVATDMNTVSVGNATTQRQIANVAAGTHANDAVNVGQLAKAGLNLDTSGNATNAFVAYDSTAKTGVTLGAGSAGAQIHNLVAGSADTDAANVSQLKALGATIGTSGTVTNSFVSYTGGNQDLISLLGASGTKISNVAAGAVGAGSKDAINGSQLYNAEASVASVLGGSAGVNADGTIKAPVYTIDGKTYSSLDKALEAAAATGSSGAGPVNGVVYDQDAHTSLTLGATGTPVKISNVANGVAPNDAVNKSQLDGVSNSIASVAPSLKFLRFGPSTAQVANAVGNDSVAIGGNAFATQTQAVAIGLFSNVSGLASVAIGARATADGKNSVAIGSDSSAEDDNVVSVGGLGVQRRITNVATGTSTTDAVNLGQVEDLIKNTNTVASQQPVKATRNLLGATVLGAQAAPVLSDVVAIGTTDKLGQAEAIGTDAIAIGLGAHAANDNTVAIGTNVAAGGVGSVAIGNISTAGGVNATSIGVNAQAMGDTSVAVGTGVKTQGTNGVALGNASYVGVNATNSVAIGYKNSVTAAGTVVLGNQVTGTGANSVVLGTGSDGTQSNVVSVGAKGSERKIVNVAAGATATDAVNVSQLTAAGLTVDTTGKVTNSFVSYTGSTKDLVTLGGTAGTTISNLKAGVAATDAVNVGQLTAAGLSIDTTGKATNSFVAYNDATKDKVTLGGTAGTTISNVKAGTTDMDAVNFKQLTDAGIVVNSSGVVQNAFVAYDNNSSMDTITLKGKSGSTKITNLTAGTLSAASSDAVNGSQLFNVASSAADAIGGTSKVDPLTGKISKPSIVVGGTTYNDLSGAIEAVASLPAGSPDGVVYDTSAHAKVTLGGTGSATPVVLTNVATGVAATDAVNVGQLTAAGLAFDTTGKATNSFVAYNDATKDKVTLGGTAGTTISNVKAGTTDMDAVNFKQLTDAGIVVNSSGVVQNAFVAYDNNSSMDTITLKGKSGSTKITNLTAGTLSAASSDAVNGSQLFNVASSAADAIGGTSKVDPLTGKISKPSIVVGGTTYNDLSGAIEAVASLPTGSPDGVVYDTSAHAKVTLGGTGSATPVVLTNVATGVAATDAVNVGQLTAAGLAFDTTGKATNSFVAYNDATKDKVTLGGTAGTTISNVKAGIADMDAVNVKQLADAGLVVNSSGVVQNAFVAYDSLAKTGVTLGEGTAGAQIHQLVAGTSATDAVNVGQLTAAGLSIDTTGKATNSFVAYNDATKDKVTLGGTAGTTISNVKAGTTDMDAVNFKQLTDAGIVVNSSGVVQNAFVAYDNNSSMDTITLKGKSGSTKITNLTAGTLSAASTDAVNGSQLFNVATSAADAIGGTSKVDPLTGKISKPSIVVGGTTYNDLSGAIEAVASLPTGSPDGVVYDTSAHVKVTLGGTAATKPVSLTNVADGVAPTDAVNKSQLDGVTSGIAGLNANLKYLRFGSTTAATALAIGTDSLAIGGNAFATQSGALAIGVNTNVSGVNSTAIGRNATADGDSSLALGAFSAANESNTVSVGSAIDGITRRIVNVANGTSTNDAVNLGQVESLITAATAQQPVKGTRNLLGATVLGAQAAPVLSDVVAVGTTDKLGQAEAIGTDAVAIGLGAHAANDNTVAIGTNVAAGGVGSVAIGNISTAGGLNATSIGVNAQAMGDTSLAIGTGVKTQGTNGVALGNGSYVGVNATNSVAIGYKNSVTAAGTIVLGNQVTASGANSVILGSGSDGSQSNVVSVGAKGSERKIVNVAAGTTDTDAVNLGQMTTAISKASVGGGGSTLITQAAAGDDLLVGAATQGTHVNFADSTGTARELTGVAAGTKDTSAVNLSQLKPVVDALGGGAKIDAAGNVTGPSYTIGTHSAKNNVGDAFKDVNTDLSTLNASVAAISADAGGAGLVAQDSVSRNLTVGAMTDGTVVDMTNKSGVARTITGVAAGAVNPNSLDAINGSQLAGVSSSFATAIGGGAMVDGNGLITQPAFTVGGKTVNNVGDAISSLDTNVTNNYTKLQTQITNISNNGGVATPNAVAYDSAAKDTLTLGTADQKTKLTNLQDGAVAAGSTDAVTGGQLYATNQDVAALQNSVQNIAANGSASIGVNGANGADGKPGTAGPAGATGADAIAMGDKASASGDHSVVIGGGATASGDGTTVIGGNGSATGANSTAIGSGSNATGANSVAIGAGSVADRDNSVSVGSDGHERQITNVAAGTQGTDAVNLNQMNSAVGGIARKAYSGIAAATALTMIPDVDANKTLSIGIGGGTFQGYAATAIGGTARITQNIKVRVGAGWSAAGTTVGAGASYQW
ncbi:YadA-like family protein [Caballeronia sp. KNU42]